ncbi:hypothetical protein [uncultured Alsobacter sp.]|uniref:hypothetical protein n=1 Tax=uncultured Alsobacter sp. TaxID=1748258 RepID=UPI0025DDBCD6|nr:hypothetical protein [uncultured Alsobacter sp.]
MRSDNASGSCEIRWWRPVNRLAVEIRIVSGNLNVEKAKHAVKRQTPHIRIQQVKFILDCGMTRFGSKIFFRYNFAFVLVFVFDRFTSNSLNISGPRYSPVDNAGMHHAARLLSCW